jgi:cyclopropane-fatty-acyl-phospholipid synthase
MTTKTSVIGEHIAPTTTPKPRFLDGLAKRALISRLEQIEHGEVILHEEDQQYRYGQRTTRCPHSVTITIYDPKFYSEVAFGGSIGAGEAYMAGYWQASDLTALIRIFLCNRKVLDGMDGGLAWLTIPLQKLLHRLNRNTVNGSQKNIAAHYDLGNDFFALFLDETMMYSNAIFTDPTMSLHEAQLTRLKHICKKLDLKPTDHVLEIGTGWGGFAIYAAKNFGCRITTTTISRAQYDLACERIAAAGLNDRVTVLLEDYRDLTGQYDKLVSIEMIEAVGHEYYETYFEKCSELLKPEGMMLLQAITIADQQYEYAKRSVDFIQRHIFPGSCIPSIAAMSQAVAKATDMRIFHLEDIGPHYNTTLRTWRDNLFSNRGKIRGLGYSDELIRMWEFYLCYCEGGFAERVIGNVHMLLTKPQNRRLSLLSQFGS